jgi:hypothetical protein
VVFCIAKPEDSAKRFGGRRLLLKARRRHLIAQRRQALQLLASNQRGITETLLFAHGVTPHMLGYLLRTGLATIRRVTIKSGDQAIEIGGVTITDDGRRWLAAWGVTMRPPRAAPIFCCGPSKGPGLCQPRLNVLTSRPILAAWL